MEFWGVEVKKGEPLKVIPGVGNVLHLSQACLGEQKKDKKESVCLFVEVGGKKLVLATLSTEKLPQQQFDLVFDSDFELTHNWKNGSVFFYGYKAPLGEGPRDFSDLEPSDSEEEEEIPLPVANNGKAKEKKPVQAETSNAVKKKESGSGKQKVQIVEPSIIEESDSDVDSGEDSDEDMSGDEDDSQEEDSEDADDSDDSEDETPKKVVPSKKRPAESTSKTPAADKKAKVTPQKTDGKKANVHVATPHPAKQAKTPANKPNPQTPKSGGTHNCTSCNKVFGSDKALESHSKAKHAAN